MLEPGVSPTDKLLFTVQIYDSFYVPNRKALRFIGGNGTVGNTPGDWQVEPSPAQHSPVLPPSPHASLAGLQVRSTWPGMAMSSGKTGSVAPHIRKSIIQPHIDS